MSYANRAIPLFAAWPQFVDPTRMTAKLWRLWRTVDNAGNIRRHEGVDETSSLQADGTFAFQGGPSFEDFPVPRPAADGIALSVHLPDGPVFRSGAYDRLPAGPPDDPNGFVSVFIPVDPITITPADLAAALPALPLTLDSARAINTLTLTLTPGSINVTGAGTDTSVAGVGFTFAFNMTLVPGASVRHLEEVVVVNVGPLTLAFTGTGSVTSTIEAAIKNVLSGWIARDLRDTVRSRLQSEIDSALTQGVGKLPPLPAGVVATVRRIAITSTEINLVAALASFGDLLAKFPIQVPSRGPCVIATAALGSDAHPLVEVLRTFRDETLFRSRHATVFRALDRHYYRLGAPVARAMRRHPMLRRVVRYLVVYPAGLAVRAVGSIRGRQGMRSV